MLLGTSFDNDQVMREFCSLENIAAPGFDGMMATGLFAITMLAK
jgi:hypothetical protein